ncbi:YtxH domain-containing protein [Candidatus Saccharibacteria bacterium]|nr:YtxH domain-containing protein [Candidatus Saccharibacteria bacterium]MBI2285432.1 YtxH domain-containing protein [Candidatus Saccharibacteria bacterium]
MVKDQHTGRKIAIGSLLAGAFGYLAGILTAPKSGKETREDIVEKASELKEEGVDQLQDLRDELNELIKNAKDKTVALSAKAREEFNEAVVSAKDAKNKAGVVLKAFKAGEADDPDLNKAIKQAKQAKKNLSQYFKS